MRYECYLFGEYNSRGGATLIEAADEDSAREAYVEAGMGYESTMQDAAEWADSPGAAGFWNELHALRHDKKAAIRKITEEQFIGKTILLSEEEVPEIDLEWDIDEDQTMLWEPEGQREANPAERTLWYGKTPPAGWVPTEYGEDACGVVFIR